MNFVFIKHSECDFQTLLKIVELKQQYWDYPVDIQMEWIKNNVFDNDVHLIIKDNETYIAYLQLSTVDDICNTMTMIGIGNVCVNNLYKNQEYGYLVMKIADFYIRQQKKLGILLCKKELIHFYQKCNWYMFNGVVEINGIKTNNFLLSSVLLSNRKININRSF